MSNLTVSSSPHVTTRHHSTQSIMMDVLIALSPVALAAVFLFGYHIIINLVVCVGGCVGFELIYDLTFNKKWNKDSLSKSSIWDCSAMVTGVILALNLPATMDVWGMNVTDATGKIMLSFDIVLVGLIGSLVAIVLVKQLFGGIGRNFANPALTGRIFLFLTFASGFVAGQTVGLGLQASTGATWLSSTSNTATTTMLVDMLIGNTGSAAVGETCAIAILVGYAYLSVRKVIDWRVPAMIVGWTAVLALLFDGVIDSKLSGADLFFNMLAHVLSGGLLFGAVFMATDYSTSPNTFIGNCIYAFGVALLTVLIRVFAAYPEGFSFALLIMNCIVPLIDKFVIPKPFGYVKPEKPAKNAEKEGK